MRWIAYGSFSGSLAIFFWFSDCTPNHPFVDPAPAYEESPDWLSALNCRSTTVLRAMVRLNHTYVIVRWQSQTPRSSGHTQTEPSAQGPLHGRDRCNQHSQLLCFMVSLGSVLYISGWTVPWLYSLSPSQSERSIELHAASLLVAKGFGWRNRGGGPPMEYAS